MKHKEYYPNRQADQIVWLANFMSKLAGYATALSLQPAQVTAAVADCGWLKYILETWLPASRAWQEAQQRAMQAALDPAIREATPLFRAQAKALIMSGRVRHGTAAIAAGGRAALSGFGVRAAIDAHRRGEPLCVER